MHLPRVSPISALALGFLLACTEPTPPAPARPVPAIPSPSRRHTPLPILPPKVPASEGKAAFAPFLHLSPMAASIAPGGTVRFIASINYDPDGPRYIRQPVNFRVEEAEGGAVDPGGLYTAPTRPGVYHVVAYREDFPGIQAKATVTVQ